VRPGDRLSNSEDERRDRGVALPALAVTDPVPFDGSRYIKSTGSAVECRVLDLRLT
jgi:hypothetical protein